MVTFQIGVKKKKKYGSLKAAYAAAVALNPDLKWMTFYMRQRKVEKQGGLGWSPITAMKAPVRKYERREQAVA